MTGLRSRSRGLTMWKPSCLKASVFFLFVICSVWLLASLSQRDLNVRDMQLLSFMPRVLTSLGLLIVTPQNRMQTPSNQESSSTEYSSNSKVERFNNSMPWLHFYASSPQMLENYFFHGYHKGLGKYHKKFTHSKLAILPFFFDRDDLVRKCVARISLNHGMAVSHQNSMSDRWQWENANEGLGKFKEKYQLFYGYASMGLCFQNFLNNKVADARRDDHKQSSEIDTNISNKLFVENMKMHSETTNCGQVLFLQHPVSRAIDEYYKTFPKKTLCGSIFSENRHNYDDDDSEVAMKNNGMDFEEDHDGIIRWIQVQGNIIFKHLVFHPQFCVKDFFLKFGTQHKSLDAKDKNTTSKSPDIDLMSSNFSSLNETTDSTGNKFSHEEAEKIQLFENICDGNMKIFLENLDMEERKYLVNYVTKNLPNWFSMVGLYEDLQKSWQMLDVVHRFPLHECIQDPLRTSRPPDSNDEKRGRKVYNNNNSRNINSLEVVEDQIGRTDRKSVADQTTVPTRSKFPNNDSTSDRSTDFNNTINSSTNNQIIFHDLKEEGHKDEEILMMDNHEELSSQQAERHFGDEEDDINNIASFSVNKHFGNEEMSFSQIQNHRSPGSKTSHFHSNIKLCNQVNDFQKLFHRLNNNEVVQKSLALDMEIYKAVKKLYQYQKQMVFNTLKA